MSTASRRAASADADTQRQVPPEQRPPPKKKNQCHPPSPSWAAVGWQERSRPIFRDPPPQIWPTSRPLLQSCRGNRYVTPRFVPASTALRHAAAGRRCRRGAFSIGEGGSGDGRSACRPRGCHFFLHRGPAGCAGSSGVQRVRTPVGDAPGASGHAGLAPSSIRDALYEPLRERVRRCATWMPTRVAWLAARCHEHHRCDGEDAHSLFQPWHRHGGPASSPYRELKSLPTLTARPVSAPLAERGQVPPRRSAQTCQKSERQPESRPTLTCSPPATRAPGSPPPKPQPDFPPGAAAASVQPGRFRRRRLSASSAVRRFRRRRICWDRPWRRPFSTWGRGWSSRLRMEEG